MQPLSIVIRGLKCLLVCAGVLQTLALHAEPQHSGWLDRFVDPEDGQFDLSDHLLKYRGLLPVPIIITEPALGYGGGLAALWFKESLEEAGARGIAESGQRAPPSIGALAAFRTQNGSSGAFAGYFTPLARDRYRVLGGAGKVSLDLDYNVTRRWAVLEFVGSGRAYGERVSWSEAETPVSRGVGLRYLIARKLELYTGIDVARGLEESAFYIQVGGAWY